MPFRAGWISRVPPARGNTLGSRLAQNAFFGIPSATTSADPFEGGLTSDNPRWRLMLSSRLMRTDCGGQSVANSRSSRITCRPSVIRGPEATEGSSSGPCGGQRLECYGFFGPVESLRLREYYWLLRLVLNNPGKSYPAARFASLPLE